jgi:amidophosphoribosyltransferase
LERIWTVGKPSEIHVRVACPPIISPCFYGIDMSTLGELFAPSFLGGGPLTPEIEAGMAAQLGATSLRYLPVESVARAIGLDADQLCQACITGRYPTPCGRRLAQIATENFRKGVSCRAYETSNGGNGRNGKKGGQTALIARPAEPAPEEVSSRLSPARSASEGRV